MFNMSGPTYCCLEKKSGRLELFTWMIDLLGLQLHRRPGIRG